MSQTAYCPWPPDCFFSVPLAVLLLTKVSRSAVRTASELTLRPYRV